MELEGAITNALKTCLLLVKPHLLHGAAMELAAVVLIYSKEINIQTPILLILATSLPIIHAMGQLVDQVEFVIRMGVASIHTDLEIQVSMDQAAGIQLIPPNHSQL